MAEKVVAGSVPIATATSSRRSLPCASAIPGSPVVPPAVSAITLTPAARMSPEASATAAARSRSRRCSAATFCRCQCMPVV